MGGFDVSVEFNDDLAIESHLNIFIGRSVAGDGEVGNQLGRPAVHVVGELLALCVKVIVVKEVLGL